MRIPVIAVGPAAALALITCGGGSTSPSPTSTLHLRAGLQNVSFAGFSISSDPQFPACTPLGVPRAGTVIATQVSLEQSGSEWVARSPSPSVGTLEIHLHGTGVATVQGDGITGTVRGFGNDLGEFLRPPIDVRVDFGGGTANLEASASRGSFFTNGRISGAVQFIDSQNATGTCSAIQWSMQPASGIVPPLAMTSLGFWR